MAVSKITKIDGLIDMCSKTWKLWWYFISLPYAYVDKDFENGMEIERSQYWIVQQNIYRHSVSNDLLAVALYCTLSSPGFGYSSQNKSLSIFQSWCLKKIYGQVTPHPTNNTILGKACHGPCSQPLPHQLLRFNWNSCLNIMDVSKETC